MSKRKYNEVKELLCDELDEYGKKTELTKEKLHEIYEITSAIVMLKSLIEDEEMEEGQSFRGMSYGQINWNGRNSFAGNNPTMSYMRGRDAQTGRYMSRDNAPHTRMMDGMSYHSAEEDAVARMQDILANTNDMRVRKAVTKAIETIEG